MTKGPAIPTNRLLRLREAAEYLSLSPWKMRNLIQSAELPIIQTGANAPWLLDRLDLDQWIERKKRTLD
jgi:excisionase family DNA binding protein